MKHNREGAKCAKANAKEYAGCFLLRVCLRALGAFAVIFESMRELRDMICVITGASSGIGKALAEALSAKGAKLVLAARRVDRLQELNQQLGGRHVCVRCDVSKPEDCQALIDRAVADLGRIDSLICNAGYLALKRIDEMSAEDFSAIVQTNVFGTTDCIRAAVPVMARQNLRDDYRGQIVIISSAAARRGLPYGGAYAATKAAQLSIAEAARIELAPLDIAVTSVHPVGTESDIFGTAEQQGRRRINAPGVIPRRHTADYVARGIVRAIHKPTREVWSSPATRILLAINALFPAIGDWAMTRERRDFERSNQIQR